MIRSASFTRLDTFETCRYRARLQYVNKVPQPEPVPPPGKLEHPMLRGSRVHDEGEAYVKGKVDQLPTEYRDFAEEMAYARELLALGRGMAEQLWPFDEHWNPLPVGPWRPDAKWYIKIDLAFNITDAHVAAIDYKTGKARGNEMKHNQQLQLYCIAVLMRYPHVEKASGELWYLDQKGLVSEPFHLTRRQGVALAKRWSERARTMMECKVFSASPSQKACRYCPYGSLNGNSYCEYDAYA